MEELFKLAAVHGPWAALAIYLVMSTNKEHAKRESQWMAFLEKQGAELAKVTDKITDIGRMMEGLQKALVALGDELHQIKGMTLVQRCQDCERAKGGVHATHPPD